ncbi:MAG: Ig-like domain-containing protein [Acetivibrio sp.]
MKQKFLTRHFFCLFISIILTITGIRQVSYASSSLSFVVLSEYEKTLSIRDEFYLIAFTSTGKKASFKSSDSKIASVNTYGKVLAKKGGTVKITAKIKDAEASCTITVVKTQITLSDTFIELEHNETFLLKAVTSSGSPVQWKTSKKSVASIEENGCITGGTPGEALITVRADGSYTTCRVKIKEPKIHLNKSSLSLYRNEAFQLRADVSSGLSPTWKSSRSSVALVDSDGYVTALKHGTALITAKVDGVIKICELTVAAPEIHLNESHLTLKKGDTFSLIATLSSPNPPSFRTSNSGVATVDSDGKITALQKGTAYITVSEDGTRIKCKVQVAK